MSEKLQMSELKPCPFCGPGSMRQANSLGSTGWVMQCQHCGASTGIKPTQEAAIAAWNTRPAEAALIAEQSLKALCEIAHKRGWNGVENSKILEEFIETEFAGLDRHIAELKKAPLFSGVAPQLAVPAESWKGIAETERARGDKLWSELVEAKDLIYRLALKVM